MQGQPKGLSPYNHWAPFKFLHLEGCASLNSPDGGAFEQTSQDWLGSHVPRGLEDWLWRRQ